MPQELIALGMSEKTWKWYHAFVARMSIKYADKIQVAIAEKPKTAS